MSTTEILAIPELAENQLQAHITVNEAVGALEFATQAYLLLDFGGAAADRTLIVEEFTRFFVFDAINSSGATNIVVPEQVNDLDVKRYFVVQNNTGSDVTVVSETAGGTSVVVGSGSSRQCHARGKNITLMSNHPSVAEVTVGVFIPNKPNAAEEALRVVFTFAAAFADDFAGSQISVDINPSSAATWAVRKNNVVIGTVVVATDGTAVFATSGGGETFAIGDTITIDTPTTQDATMSNVSIMLKAERV